MALEWATILAVAKAVQQFANIPVIERFLEHISHGTTFTRIDDWLVDALCDVPETEIPAAAAVVQARIDGLPPEARIEMKQNLIMAGGPEDDKAYQHC